MVKNYLDLVPFLIENEKELLKYVLKIHKYEEEGLTTTNLFRMELNTKGRTTKDSSFSVKGIHMGYFDEMRGFPKNFYLVIEKETVNSVTYVHRVKMSTGDTIVIGKNFISFRGKYMSKNSRVDLRLSGNHKSQILHAVSVICSAIKIDLEVFTAPETKTAS